MRTLCLSTCLFLLFLPLMACHPIQPITMTPVHGDDMPAAQLGVNGEMITIGSPSESTIPQYAHIELRLTTNLVVANPYDPAVADLLVHFTGPTGHRMTVPAFWMQPYDENGTPTGTPGWHVRFTPPVAGAWQAQAEIGTVQARSAPLLFTVTPSDNPGFIHIDPNNPRYFAFDDGTPYFVNGLNIGWSTGDVLADYARWFDQLAANEGNLVRIWMASWSFGIEWSDTGLGNYEERMAQAWLLDRVFEMAEERGIYIMLCLLNHGAFSTSVNPEWEQNPYNAALGGPLSTPAEFVTDPVAKTFFKQRLRYIAARWGYSTNLMAWEWWNEVNWTGIGDKTLIPWIEEMTPVLQAYDPYDHLITNSNANGAFTQVWALDEIDFSQQHDYTGGDLLATLAADYRRITDIAPDKPILMGELGYSAGAQDALDALHLHMGLWGAPFLGYAGGSMYWWWDTFIDTQDQWHQYGALGRFFAGEALASLTPGDAEVSGEATALTLQNRERILLWLRSNSYSVPAAQAAYDKALLDAIRSKTKLTDWAYEPSVVSGVTVTLNGLTAGNYTVAWYAPTTGEWLEQADLTVTDGATLLTAPDFAGDLAAKIVPVHDSVNRDPSGDSSK